MRSETGIQEAESENDEAKAGHRSCFESMTGSAAHIKKTVGYSIDPLLKSN